MALALKKGSVARGRVDDGFAAAGVADGPAIVTEPAPSSRDMALVSDTIVTQNRLTSRLMGKLVHVRLDKPYMGDPQRTITLVWGREDATPVGQDRYQDDGDGTPPVTASERLFTQGAEFAAPRWEPGKWVHYHLRYEEGPLGECTCGQDPDTIVGPEAVIPSPVAKHWFGDWETPLYELKVRPGVRLEEWLKRAWHRDRVATENWGGYEMDFPVGVPIYDNRGAINYRALRKYGPPNVPHVTITRLDSMMRRIPESAAKPWEIFKWGDACEKTERMHFFENKHVADKFSVTQDELQKMIAQGVAAALAAERETHARKSKPKGENA